MVQSFFVWLLGEKVAIWFGVIVGMFLPLLGIRFILIGKFWYGQ